MKPRRFMAAIAATAALSVLGACTSEKPEGNFTASSSDTGVTVKGSERVLDGDLKVEKADKPPTMSKQLNRVGDVTHIEGKLRGDVTVTLPVPKDYTGALEDLWILKNDGASWTPLVPQKIDAKKRTLSITTRSFSFWTLGTWQQEEAAAQLAANLRNLTSSDGAWIISDAAKLTGNAPVTECRYPALTLKLDASKFVKGAILCPKFVTKGKDAKGRTTYDLHISNVQTYPVKLWLNSGVTFKKVAPAPNNPIHQIMQATAQSQRVVTLPGAGELVLTVRGDTIPKGGIKISGGLDFTTLMVDLTFAAIKTTTGLDLKGTFLKDLKKANELAGYVACVIAGSKSLTEEFQQNKQADMAEFGGKIFKEAMGCMKAELLEAVLKDYYRNKGVYMAQEELVKWLAKVSMRTLDILESAPVLVSLASAIGTVKYGRTTYLLNIINNDPATDALYKALPTPGKGGFEPAMIESAGPASGGQPTYVGTPCMVDKQEQPWGTWSLSGAYGSYVRSGIDTTIQVTYVRPEHKDTVRALFGSLVGDRAKCEIHDKGSLVILEKHDGRRYGDLTDYRVGQMGWENSEYMPYGVVTAYDPTKGVVVHISLSADPYSGIGLADIKEQLPGALDYVANKLDVSLGTAYTLN